LAYGALNKFAQNVSFLPHPRSVSAIPCET